MFDDTDPATLTVEAILEMEAQIIFKEARERYDRTVECYGGPPVRPYWAHLNRTIDGKCYCQDCVQFGVKTHV